ncbi:glutamate synthase [NADPH] large subunit [Staphylococcus aureus]|nr:glutamate synthase [NADPH] large subunit [Staphylococcus aureus]
MTMLVKDYLVVRSLSKHLLKERQNEIIAGNVSFYGATGGKALLTVVQEKDSVLEIVV